MSLCCVIVAANCALVTHLLNTFHFDKLSVTNRLITVRFDVTYYNPADNPCVLLYVSCFTYWLPFSFHWKFSFDTPVPEGCLIISLIFRGGLQERHSTDDPTHIAILSTLSVKIVVRTQNPVSSQDEFTQMLCGKISRSNLHSVEWRFEWRSCNPP